MAVIATGASEPDEDDDALMRRSAAGDKFAFGQLVQRYQDRVQSFATYLLCGDRDAACDAVQEVFLGLWQARSAYTPCGRLVPYLLQITRSQCRDSQRRSRARPAEPLDERLATPPPQDARLRQLALGELIAVALSELPEPQRTVFVLSHYEGLSYREIAELMECPMGTVASRKSLAVEALRRRLQEWLEE